jgi:hypothetical protein
MAADRQPAALHFTPADADRLNERYQAQLLFPFWILSRRYSSYLPYDSFRRRSCFHFGVRTSTITFIGIPTPKLMQEGQVLDPSWTCGFKIWFVNGVPEKTAGAPKSSMLSDRPAGFIENCYVSAHWQFASAPLPPCSNWNRGCIRAWICRVLRSSCRGPSGRQRHPGSR